MREKICHANINKRKAGVAIFISHKVDFRGKKIIIKRNMG